MILGIGADLCYIERIRRSLDHFGDAWIDHLFSANERELCMAVADPAVLFAQGFCGKEACAKALGTGLAGGLGWRDIEVLPSSSGVSLRLQERALNFLARMMPEGYEACPHVACCGDKRLAQSLVLISAVPKMPRAGAAAISGYSLC